MRHWRKTMSIKNENCVYDAHRVFENYFKYFAHSAARFGLCSCANARAHSTQCNAMNVAVFTNGQYLTRLFIPTTMCRMCACVCVCRLPHAQYNNLLLLLLIVFVVVVVLWSHWVD